MDWKGVLYRGDDLSRRYSSQEQVGWNLTDNVADGEDRRAGYELVAVHLQVLLHTAQKGIVDIVQVKVLEEVSDLGESVLARLHVVLLAIGYSPKQMLAQMRLV
jgi:hypothetical protein